MGPLLHDDLALVGLRGGSSLFCHLGRRCSGRMRGAVPAPAARLERGRPVGRLDERLSSAGAAARSSLDPAGSALDRSERLADAGFRPSPFLVDPLWAVAIAGVWALLSLWRGAYLVAGAMRGHGLAARAIPLRAGCGICSALLQVGMEANSAARRSFAPRRRSSVPASSASFTRAFFFPPACPSSLSASELRQVVMHEMEHLRRADDWTNLLQKAGLVSLPAESGAALGGAPALRGAGACLRRPRPALDRRPQGLRDLSHPPGGVFDAFAAAFHWRSAPGSGGRSWCGACIAFCGGRSSPWAASKERF